MSATVWGWMSALGALDTAALPSPWLMRWSLCLGWGVVLAWAGAALAQALPRRGRLAVAALLFAWCWVPGPLAPVHWLGLAFQMPSNSTVLLCAVLLQAQCFPAAQGLVPEPRAVHRGVLWLAALGVVAGWLLLLDTLAWLPVPWYAWGFSPLASGLVWLVTVLPWVLGPGPQSLGRVGWVAPLAVVVFVVLRLPTGNVWDAVLDPWLWVALHVYAVRVLWRGRRAAVSA